MLALTIKGKKEYFENKGEKCPSCKSEVIENYGIDRKGLEEKHYCICKNCGVFWIETWKTVDIELETKEDYEKRLEEQIKNDRTI